MSHGAEFQPGELVGALRIRRFLGSGGFGEVYVVEHGPTNRREVLKIPKGEYRQAGNQLAGARTQEVFLREARRQGPLSHPHIVRVYDAGILTHNDEPIPFLRMELVQGQTLHDRIEKAPEKRLPWHDACRLLAPIAEALAYLSRGETLHAPTYGPEGLSSTPITDGGSGSHCARAAEEAIASRAGLLEGAPPLVHLDVKPTNILLGERGEVKLTDFGISVRLGRTGDRRISPGTRGYVAPEIIAGDAPGPPADVYSLGCTLYCALTGRVPTERDRADLDAMVKGEQPSTLGGGELVPVELPTLLAAMLADQPEERPAAGGVANRLQALVNTDAALPPSMPVATGLARRKAQGLRPVALRSLAVILLFGVGVGAAVKHWPSAGIALPNLSIRGPISPTVAEAQAAAARGETHEAHRILAAILKQPPVDPGALRARAELEVRTQDWARASADLKELIRLGTGTDLDQLTLMDCYLNEQPPRVNEVLETLEAMSLEQLSTREAERAGEFLYEAVSLLSPLPDAQRAQIDRTAHRLASREPPPIPAIKVAVLCYLEAETPAGFQRAVQMCNRGLEREAKDPELWLLAGRTRQITADRAGAHSAYQRALWVTRAHASYPAGERPNSSGRRSELEARIREGLRETAP